MDEPEVNQHGGSMSRALGTCPGFSETNGDTRWPFAPDSRTLSGACSPCQGGRQTGFTLESDRLGGLRREAAPAPYTLDSLPTPIHPASRRALSESLEITGRSPILPSHNPELSTLASYPLMWRRVPPALGHRPVKQLTQVPIPS